MLPGVGAFGASMARLVELGLDQALRERIAADRPTIAICVGHQLLFETSDESPGRARARHRAGACRQLPGRRPRAAVRLERGRRPSEARDLLEDGYAYFANSFRATEAPGWTIASGDAWRALRGRHGARQRRSAASSIPSCPGAYGEALLSRFLELA